MPAGGVVGEARQSALCRLGARGCGKGREDRLAEDGYKAYVLSAAGRKRGVGGLEASRGRDQKRRQSPLSPPQRQRGSVAPLRAAQPDGSLSLRARAVPSARLRPRPRPLPRGTPGEPSLPPPPGQRARRGISGLKTGLYGRGGVSSIPPLTPGGGRAKSDSPRPALRPAPAPEGRRMGGGGKSYWPRERGLT